MLGPTLTKNSIFFLVGIENIITKQSIATYLAPSATYTWDKNRARLISRTWQKEFKKLKPDPTDTNQNNFQQANETTDKQKLYPGELLLEKLKSILKYFWSSSTFTAKVENNNLGGINMNHLFLNLETQGQKNNLNLPANINPILSDIAEIQGLTPAIFQTIFLPNLYFLLK